MVEARAEKALVNLEVRDPSYPDKDDVANVTFPAADAAVRLRQRRRRLVAV
jgi:hypothetical protein